jgi:hypothetical protein
MDNLGKNWQDLMDNLGKNWQLINILFCGYRRLEIDYCRSMKNECRNLYTRLGTVPQRVMNNYYFKMKIEMIYGCRQ